jgi:hypothetical protein
LQYRFNPDSLAGFINTAITLPAPMGGTWNRTNTPFSLLLGPKRQRNCCFCHFVLPYYTLPYEVLIVAVSLRCAEQELAYLAQLSDQLGVGQSEVLRRGLQLLAQTHLPASANAFELGKDLFGGAKATVADANLARNLSKHIRQLARAPRIAR